MDFFYACKNIFMHSKLCILANEKFSSKLEQHRFSISYESFYMQASSPFFLYFQWHYSQLTSSHGYRKVLFLKECTAHSSSAEMKSWCIICVMDFSLLHPGMSSSCSAHNDHKVQNLCIAVDKFLYLSNVSHWNAYVCVCAVHNIFPSCLHGMKNWDLNCVHE